MSADPAKTAGPRYEESGWKPRAILPTADALGNKFWPPSPVEVVDFADATFEASRLRPAPATTDRNLLFGGGSRPG